MDSSIMVERKIPAPCLNLSRAGTNCGRDTDGKIVMVTYHELIPMLLKWGLLI
jgi:hypothetical protein